jgi:hypothetical protein
VRLDGGGVSVGGVGYLVRGVLFWGEVWWVDVMGSD